MQVGQLGLAIPNAGKFIAGFIIVVAEWCRLTCFVVGQEEPADSCRINAMKYPPALPAIYPKGVSYLSAISVASRLPIISSIHKLVIIMCSADNKADNQQTIA